MMCIHNDLWVPGANLFIWIRTLFQMQLGKEKRKKKPGKNVTSSFRLKCFYSVVWLSGINGAYFIIKIILRYVIVCVKWNKFSSARSEHLGFTYINVPMNFVPSCT